MRHIPADVQEQSPRIAWPQMRGIRNAVVHRYWDIDAAILWQTITEDLPVTRALLQELLDRETEGRG